MHTKIIEHSSGDELSSLKQNISGLVANHFDNLSSEFRMQLHQLMYGTPWLGAKQATSTTTPTPETGTTDISSFHSQLGNLLEGLATLTNTVTNIRENWRINYNLEPDGIPGLSVDANLDSTQKRTAANLDMHLVNKVLRNRIPGIPDGTVNAIVKDLLG